MRKKISPKIYSYAQHGIDNSKIDARSLRIISKLRRANYNAYIVGGSLRDILLGNKPKDFDVVTNASPEEIKEIFPRALIIGKRFKLVHVRNRGHVTEISTLRVHEMNPFQRLKSLFCSHGNFRANIYGSCLFEDSHRRDITMNALYYDPKTKEIIDYHGGYEDAKSRSIKIIGNPNFKFQEDPMRMARVVRFAAKLDLDIETNLKELIHSNAEKLKNLPGSRMFVEFMKFFMTGHAYDSYKKLVEYDLMKYFIAYDWQNTSEQHNQLLTNILHDMDERYKNSAKISPAFLIIVLLWPLYFDMMGNLMKIKTSNSKFLREHKNIYKAMQREQREVMPIPIKLLWQVQKVWEMQFRLKIRDKRQSVIANSNFKFAYNLFKHRAAVEPELRDIFKHWEDYTKTRIRTWVK